MLRAVLDRKQADLLVDERAVLQKLQVVLSGWEVTPADQRRLTESLRQLDELFLLVVVGEFNSGKSAFINALLGEPFVEEGVTPTTDRIQVLRHQDDADRPSDGSGVVSLFHQAAFLRDINIVDTPGTNAIIRQHEQLTQDFVPRSDLVIFVTSADRPFTESERAFLESIRKWGKKVIVVLNKIDLLEEADVQQVQKYIEENMVTLLGFTPEVFPISARQALKSKQAGSTAEQRRLRSASRFQAVENYILKTLDEKNRLRLKLVNPVGVGEQLAAEYRDLAQKRRGLLEKDIKAINSIEEQLEVYKADMQHDFRYRLADVEKILLAMENRGMIFFDETLRLARVFDLINTQRISREFEKKVAAETPQQIEQEVSSLIDWMVERDLRQWRSTLEYIENRMKSSREEQDRPISGIDTTFELNRRRLLDSVGVAARKVMETYDREAEAGKLAESVRSTIAGTALVEVGAVGLGVLLVTVLNTALLDFTGILAAGSVAVLGFLILPARRRRAKRELADRLESLRKNLVKAMEDAFEKEQKNSLQRLRESIAPYTRFVRSEQQKLARVTEEIDGILAELARIKLQIDEI